MPNIAKNTGLHQNYMIIIILPILFGIGQRDFSYNYRDNFIFDFLFENMEWGYVLKKE